MAPTNLSLKVDASPLLTFLSLFREASDGPLDLGDLGLELARVETDHGSAVAAEFAICLYPSDALLRLATARLARKFDALVVEDSAHG